MVHICENGGAEAFDALTARLGGENGPLREAADVAPPAAHAFVRLRTFRIRASGTPVLVGDAGENLGYGGGINRWLRPLMAQDWPGLFILNPDAAPAPDALAILKNYAEMNGKGMVTGRITLADAPDRIQTRGLRWRPWMASNEAVGRHAPSEQRPDAAAVEAMLDAPSGAAFYVTRACIERIGPMREDYFLYYEDLDWGMRAKRACGIGYAYDAVIVHKGGTTIGSGDKKTGSILSTYLEFRNRLLFVRRERPRWRLWSIAMSLARALEFSLHSRPDKTRAALTGLWHGLLGRGGRPDDMLRRRDARATPAED